MRVALIGATGPVGERILRELLDRKHSVTAVVRDIAKVSGQPGVRAVSADIDDTQTLSEALRNHDAVISSVRFLKFRTEKLLSAIRASGVKRYLCVGGAASLFAPGTTTRLIDSGQIPEQYLPEPTAGTLFFAELKKEKELEWTFLSPPMMFSNDIVFGKSAGGRTGQFRVGKDELLVSGSGESTISYEDYAVAMVDELEKPRHIRQRFTVGY